MRASWTFQHRSLQSTPLQRSNAMSSKQNKKHVSTRSSQEAPSVLGSVKSTAMQDTRTRRRRGTQAKKMFLPALHRRHQAPAKTRVGEKYGHMQDTRRRGTKAKEKKRSYLSVQGEGERADVHDNTEEESIRRESRNQTCFVAWL